MPGFGKRATRTCNNRVSMFFDVSSPAGTTPSTLLCARERYRRLGDNSTSGGIDPESAFPETSRCVSLGNVKTELGIAPVSPSPTRVKCVSSVNDTMAVSDGNVETESLDASLGASSRSLHTCPIDG